MSNKTRHDNIRPETSADGDGSINTKKGFLLSFPNRKREEGVSGIVPAKTINSTAESKKPNDKGQSHGNNNNGGNNNNNNSNNSSSNPNPKPLPATGEKKSYYSAAGVMLIGLCAAIVAGFGAFFKKKSED